MRTEAPPYLLFFFAIILANFSCAEGVNFHQADDINPQTVAEANLLYLELEPNDFTSADGLQEVLVLTDTTRLEVINSTYFNNNLRKADVVIELTNSLPRAFNLEVEFLDDFDDLKYEVNTNVGIGLISSPTMTTAEVTVTEAEMPTFKLSTKVVLRFVLNNGLPSLTQVLEGNIKIRSKATFYLDL